MENRWIFLRVFIGKSKALLKLTLLSVIFTPELNFTWLITVYVNK
jgi:hypothetical protein